MWTFAFIEGVEPTNNHAEGVLRGAVLWRKGSFGCTSEGGCRYVERILTVVQTLRLQGRPVLTYLQEALSPSQGSPRSQTANSRLNGYNLFSRRCR